MKKSISLKWTIICLLTFTVSNLLAQNTFNQDTSFNSQMNQVFAPLDKTRIPYGILQDYAMELTNLAAYNGTLLVDSTKTTYGTVMDIYNTVCSGAISSNAGSFLHPIYVDSIWQMSRQAGVITLGGLFYQYSSFLPNAVSSNLITVDIPSNVTTIFRGKVTTQSYSRFFIKKVTFISVDFC